MESNRKSTRSARRPGLLAGRLILARLRSLRKSSLLLFLLLSIFTHPVFAYESPGRPTGFVNDFAGVFPLESKAGLEAKLSAFEKETGVEISAITVPSLGDETVETYAEKLFQEWGIGKADKDTGLLILIAPTDREARIEVGYGLEPVITDVVSSVIMRETMIPAFKAGDYFAGVNGAADIIMGVIKGDPDALEFVASASSPIPNFSEFSIFVIIIIIQLIPVMIYSKSWWLGGVVGFILGFVIFFTILPALTLGIIGLILDYFLSKKFGGKRPPGTHGGVWFGGLGGGRGGGGFGGFGGGMSGGGGASGRW